MQNKKCHREGADLGVSWVAGQNCWVAQLSIGSTRIYIGRYTTREDAKHAHAAIYAEWYGVPPGVEPPCHALRHLSTLLQSPIAHHHPDEEFDDLQDFLVEIMGGCKNEVDKLDKQA
jgi:hypothetical protein